MVISEVGEQDIWQRAELGCAVVSGDRQKAHELLDEVVRIAVAAMVAGDAQLIAVAKDVVDVRGPGRAVRGGRRSDRRGRQGRRDARATGVDPRGLARGGRSP